MSEITMKEYNKQMDKIIAKKLPVHETLIAMVEEASKYTIIKTKDEKHTSKI